MHQNSFICNCLRLKNVINTNKLIKPSRARFKAFIQLNKHAYYYLLIPLQVMVLNALSLYTAKNNFLKLVFKNYLKNDYSNVMIYYLKQPFENY